jgi:hypothetical protein
MNKITKALDLPTSYRVIKSAKGHLRSGKYVEIAALHSGTAGHKIALAVYQDGEWSEVSERFFNNTAGAIFDLPSAH